MTLGNLTALLHWQGSTALLQEALTHRSSAQATNERLEFVGDRVLNLVVAAWLHRLQPSATEGELSLQHTTLVRAEACAQIAEGWQLWPLLVMGADRRSLTDVARQRLLADTTEALLGAVFLQQGYTAAQHLIEQHWSPLLATATQGTGKDAKTMVQELLQARGLPLPQYSVVSQAGPDHAAEFVVAVTSALGAAEGQGRSKQAASLAAAAALLKELLKDLPA